MCRIAFVSCASFVLCACASAPAPTTQPAPAKPIPAPAPIESSEPEQPSALSYGMVTSQVRKGVTTQLELVQLFGSPNISTYDSAGVESWVWRLLFAVFALAIPSARNHAFWCTRYSPLG